MSDALNEATIHLEKIRERLTSHMTQALNRIEDAAAELAGDDRKEMDGQLHMAREATLSSLADLYNASGYLRSFVDREASASKPAPHAEGPTA